MSDLRTGLVEAMARVLAAGRGIKPEVWDNPRWLGDRSAYRYDAEDALDAALGFLTDNARAWEMLGYQHDQPYPRSFPEALIAVLSDSRDTGEKP